MEKKSAEKIFYEAFLRSGAPGYYMLYRALKEKSRHVEDG